MALGRSLPAGLPSLPARPSRRRVLRQGSGAALGIAAGAALAGCGSGSGDGVGADGRVTIELWHGQTDTGRAAIEGLVKTFNATHPGIRVDPGGGVLADSMLQKVTAALASGSYPDIAYIFGSDLAGIARSPRVVDLTRMVGSLPLPWSDYWAPAWRRSPSTGGYVPPPRCWTRWRWCATRSSSPPPDCRCRRPAGPGTSSLTWRPSSPTRGAVYGTGWPGVGDEDTVWRLWPMIWDLGGDVVAPNGKGIGFADSGVRALETVQALAGAKSVYIDPKPGSEQMYQVFNSGRMGMVATGPWGLPDIIDAKIDYHVVPLPSYSGKPMTISGPDTWTVFDNGDARVRAAQTFVSWLMQPAQDVRWDVEAGSLPLSRSTEKLAAWRAQEAGTDGMPVFTRSLDTARVRPVHPAYPQISEALGQAIVSVLLGRSTPAKALRRCADEANAALLIPR